MNKKTATKNNKPIRDAMRVAGIAAWQLADMLGVHENTVYRMLRHELSPEDQQDIVALIESRTPAR